MTAFYTTRLFIRTFLGKPRDEEIASHARETSPVMTLPLVFLAFMSIVAGFFVFQGFGSAFGFPGGFSEFVFLHHPEVFHVDWGLVGLSTVVFVIGTFGGAWLYWERPPGPLHGARRVAAERLRDGAAQVLLR